MSSPIPSLTRFTSKMITGRPVATTLWLGATSQTDHEVASALTPAINNLLDRLVLLSPRTWYGVLQTQTQSAFNAFDAMVMIQSLLATLLPWIALAYAFRNFGSIRQREFLWKTITPAVWLSPWTLSAICSFVIQCIRLYPPLVFYWKGRMEALPSAIHTLNERVQQGRVTRHRRYDIYWPSTTVDTSSNSESPTMGPPDDETPFNTTAAATNTTTESRIPLLQAILILPGFGISHVAYSEVASRFADAGILAVVVSMEPLRFAHRHLGADVVSLTRIMKRVQGDHTQYEWNLLGHSAGGFAAMHLYQQFQRQQQQQQQQSSNPPRIHVRTLILWGCAAIIDMCTDLTPLFQPTDPVSILVLQATQDMLLEMTKDFQPEFQRHFPSRQTRTEWIQGGTHQGFASYESTWAGSPDMATAIPYSEQQLEACTKTISFLLPNSTRHTKNELMEEDTE